MDAATSNAAKTRIDQLKAEQAQIEDAQTRNAAKLAVIAATIKGLEPLVIVEPPKTKK